MEVSKVTHSSLAMAADEATVDKSLFMKLIQYAFNCISQHAASVAATTDGM